MRMQRQPATGDPQASTSSARPRRAGASAFANATADRRSSQSERRRSAPAIPAFALFDTAIGQCAIVWSQDRVAGVLLPEAYPNQTRARLLRNFPHAREASPPHDVQRALDGIVALLRGDASDLSFITLDMDGVPAFHRRVYEVARTIPPGTTISYGEIASRLGEPHASRAVGQALGRNPFPIIVPCHRVLASGGRTGGFSAPGGRSTKLRLLAIEGVRLMLE